MDGLQCVAYDNLLWRGNVSDKERRLLRSLFSTSSQADEGSMVAYLLNGISIAANGLFLDHFRGTDVTALEFLSDGVWLWTNALAFHVQHYHLRLPDRFIQHMRSRKWSPPPADSIIIDELTARMHEAWPIFVRPLS